MFIIKENHIKGIVVGNPLNMDGSPSRSSQSVKDKIVNISKEIDIPICLWDERLSTVGSFNISSELDVNISKRRRICQCYINRSRQKSRKSRNILRKDFGYY